MKEYQVFSSCACWQVPRTKEEEKVEEEPKPEDLYLRQYLVTFRITTPETKVS